MHGSIWKFTGDPDELAARYDAMVAEMPTDEFVAHLCLRAPDGIVIIDTCPSPRRVRRRQTASRPRLEGQCHRCHDPLDFTHRPGT